MLESKLACDSSSKTHETFPCSQPVHMPGSGSSHLYLQRTVSAPLCVHERQTLIMWPERVSFIHNTTANNIQKRNS